jgi:membrane associated rhomboid family serine protease
MAIRDELTMQWKIGGTLVRLILINVAVFLAMLVVDLVMLFVAQDPAIAEGMGRVYMRQWIECPQDLSTLITRPWTMVTYMFAHEGLSIGHVFFNMLMLWFAGRLFQNILGDKRLLGNYLLGGFSGLLLFLLFYNLFPMYRGEGWIVGASAAVMSVLIGIAAYRPQMIVHLMLIGPVKLMYVAGLILVLDLVSIRMGDNSGGHIAHLGGALYGVLSARMLDAGKDPSTAFVNWLERIWNFVRGRKRARMRIVGKEPKRRVTVSADADFNSAKKDVQARVDAILDKIGRSGYDSLTKDEREFLQRASKNK